MQLCGNAIVRVVKYARMAGSGEALPPVRVTACGRASGRASTGYPLHARIGIAIGDVAAGVMGRLQPRFLLVGPALASAEMHEKLCHVDWCLLSLPPSLSPSLSLQPPLSHARTHERLCHVDWYLLACPCLPVPRARRAVAL